MGGANSWRVNVTFEDWMRDIEKRLLYEERRPMIRSASDLLGPGAGPYAVETQDWNADETAFNGNFYSLPGALNSPDPADYWIGTTEGTPDGNGYELVRAYDPVTGDATGDSFVRFFHTTSGQRLYSDWLPAGGGGGGGATPSGPAGGDLGGTYPNPTVLKAQTGFNTPDIYVKPQTGLADAIDVKVLGPGTTDTQARFHVNGNGLVTFGDGSTTPDTNLYRSGPNALKTDDSFSAASMTSGGFAVVTEAMDDLHLSVWDEGTSIIGLVKSLDFRGPNVTVTAAATGLARIDITGAPSGTAGGELSGTYPNPTVNGITFTFAVASTLWSLPHNLNKTYAQIFTTDNSRVETFGNVGHLDANNAEVRWAVPMTGFARVSA